VAALIEAATGVDPAVVEGARGEFSVRVDGHVVAQKSKTGFPSEDQVVQAVRAALSS
jgi:predicted Rdx family selenoprotein